MIVAPFTSVKSPFQHPFQRCFQRRCAPASGVGLIELLVCVAILAVLLVTALPGLRHGWLRQRLAQAAHAVLVDLQRARSEALLGARTLQLRFGEDSAGACYVLYAGPAEGCRCRASGPPECVAGTTTIRLAQWPLRAGFPSLRANVASMRFNGRQGTVTPTGTVSIRIEGIGEVRHIVGITGRPRSCGLDGAPARYPRCA